MEILSEAIGIDIVVEEQDVPCRGFSVDLYATEEGTGRRIIIENQLEETNHDHLGKILPMLQEGCEEAELRLLTFLGRGADGK